MEGLIILAVIFGYIFFAKIIVDSVYESYGTKKAKNIALAIMILIPTWDIILGYPIYKYLCWTKAGVHIYKTIDNVEGFYVGEDIGTYSKVPPLPYKSYNFIEYKKRKKYDKPYKYYKVFWVDANTTKNCINIGNASNYYNLDLYKHGKCIVKKEIPKSEVTALWEISKKEIHDYHLLYLKITSVYVEVIDPRTKDKYFTVKDYMVDKSWITGALNPVSESKDRYYCNGIVANTDNTIGYYSIVNYILNSKKGEK